jgi:UDP-glucose 4-epimerase
MNILITGGTGYIGSHTVVELVAAGHEVVIADNLANSDVSVLERLAQITGQAIPFEQVDLCDTDQLAAVFQKHQFDAVIHFAGLKAVGESVAQPLSYYRTNLVSTLNLCEQMRAHNVRQLVFSSSATVYGFPETVPVTEEAPVHATNPYGHTKAMIEQILYDLAAAESDMQITLLRYFNPVGAHPSGLIGEDPRGTPNNLLPYIARVASGQLDKLRIFGDDYDTPDGTGVRDYIHVVDLARGHLAALQHMPQPGTCEVYNLGTGHGHSVLEAVAAFQKASGKDIPYQIVARRPGDAAISYADPTKAQQNLGWKAALTLDQACTDAWRWQQFIAKV